jgi:hypothetical protein
MGLFRPFFVVLLFSCKTRRQAEQFCPKYVWVLNRYRKSVGKGFLYRLVKNAGI